MSMFTCVYTSTLGQLLIEEDINGNKIFENDIVEAHYVCETFGVPKECEDTGIIKMGTYKMYIQKKEDWPLKLYLRESEDLVKLKVIGNKFDNPELLAD